MSKIDAMRAMREAKYAARNAGPGKPAASRKPPARPTLVREPASDAPRVTDPAGTATKAPAVVLAEVLAEAPAEPALCGHRSMNGRTCTREQGHSAQSHRYS
jgi:hypothetical protein